MTGYGVCVCTILSTLKCRKCSNSSWEGGWLEKSQTGTPLEPDGRGVRAWPWPRTLLTHWGGQRGTPVEYSTEARHWRHNSDNHGPACMLGTEIRMHTGTAVRGDMHSKRDRRAGVRKLPPRLTPKAPPANLTRGRGVYLALRVRSPSVNSCGYKH